MERSLDSSTAPLRNQQSQHFMGKISIEDFEFLKVDIILHGNRYSAEDHSAR
jgi:hypothetical protein